MTEAKTPTPHPIARLKTSLILFKFKTHELLTREKAPWYILIAIALIYGFGIFSRGMQNMDYFIIWTRDFVHGNLLAEYHINRVTPPGAPEDLTVPYTPFSLYLIGGVAKFLLLFLPDRDSTFALSVNITSVATSFGIYYLLKQKFHSDGYFAPWIYLITPAVFIATPILGYQDSIMTLFIISAIWKAQESKYLLSGILAGLAVMSKQLAAMPIFGLLCALLATVNLSKLLKWLTGLVFATVITLSPFIFTGNILNYLKAQFLASVHTMLSAQGANFPWLGSFVYRVLTSPLKSAILQGGDVLEIHSASLRRCVYLSLGILSILIFLNWIILTRRKNNFSPERYPQAAAVMYLSYYLFASGVHENHIYPTIAILSLAWQNREIRRAYFVLSGGLALHLVNYYGLGRSFFGESTIRISYPGFSLVLVIASTACFFYAFILVCKAKMTNT